MRELNVKQQKKNKKAAVQQGGATHREVVKIIWPVF